MQVNPEDSPPDIYVTWSNPRMTDFENRAVRMKPIELSFLSPEEDLYWVWSHEVKGQGHIRSCSWPDEDLYWVCSHEVKGQGHIRTSIFVPFPQSTLYQLSFDLWWYFTHLLLWLKEHPYWLEVECQGQIKCLNFASLPPFWPTMVVLLTWLCCQLLEKDSYWFFGSKGQGKTLKVWICCRGWYLSF